ncbi:multicopper oxidase, type 3 [Deinococcus phoenicis]|uniref:Multicopper oxidase, type 3 n=2 Tax=Deinococcus TaxID=1298 RepID=A0A016QKE1_9DEIO|nr:MULTISPECIES: copper oxidase [Deinococcus]ABF43992.1 multicopper oxidase, type 3 [Deinococcus geothermalis DSM 11300]EYB66451.1 multicopper oxidase, type 3 [Deinococcus phoenicis]
MNDHNGSQQPSSPHGEMDMTPKVSRPQIAAVTILSVLALAAGVGLAAQFGDLSMSARNTQAQGGQNMSGMDMNSNASSDTMSGMAMGGGAPSGGTGNQSMPGMNMGTSASSPTPVSQLPETPLQTPTRMGNLVMPPGMIMTRGMPMEAMQDMAAVELSQVRFTAPAAARGDQPLAPQVVNGVKVFNFETSVIRWNILPDVQVAAYAVNRQVPGPRLELTQGDRVRINVKNSLPEPTTIHWHGLIVPNGMDGAADVTQKPIAPGQTFTYEFTVQQAGTYFYHSHKNPDRQQGLGLYGALLVKPKDPAREPKADLDYTVQLQEWLQRDGYTFPAMIMEGALPNFFTINGKAYPATDTIRMKIGQTVKLRFIGSNNNFVHPMHVHGGPFEVVARDGETLKESARFLADTVNVGPGQRYDVIWKAREKGTWLIHCHIPHHITNDNVEVEGGGGLTMLIQVS